MVNVGNVLSNPTIGFKLDPGEPGIGGSAPASTSALKVIPHELGNIHRFESEALAKGGVVIEESITLDVQKVGSYLTVAGGHSKAVILYSKDGKPVLAPDEGGQNPPREAKGPPPGSATKEPGVSGNGEGDLSLIGEPPQKTGSASKDMHVTGEENRSPEYNEALRDPEESEDARVEQRNQAMNPITNPILLRGEMPKQGATPPAFSGANLDLLI